MEKTEMKTGGIVFTLDEAIKHCKENVQKETQNGNLQCAIEHNQLAMWLSQLKESKAKATAYDRLMSMNSISENDIQIVLDGNAWCAYRLPFRNLQEDDAGFGDTPQIALTALLESEQPEEWREER